MFVSAWFGQSCPSLGEQSVYPGRQRNLYLPGYVDCFLKDRLAGTYRDDYEYCFVTFCIVFCAALVWL